MFFVDIIRVFVVNQIFGSLEILGFEYAVVFKVFSTKRWWKKNDKTYKLKDCDPSFSLFVEEHPAVEQILNMITLNDSGVLFFGVF